MGWDGEWNELSKSCVCLLKIKPLHIQAIAHSKLKCRQWMMFNMAFHSETTSTQYIQMNDMRVFAHPIMINTTQLLSLCVIRYTLYIPEKEPVVLAQYTYWRYIEKQKTWCTWANNLPSFIHDTLTTNKLVKTTWFHHFAMLNQSPNKHFILDLSRSFGV